MDLRGAGAWLRKPLARIPETELKWGVGVLLSAFGLFVAGEGLGIEWPGGDAAVLYLMCLLGGTSHLQAHWLMRPPRTRMATLRALKKLILGETWIVPLGLLVILVACALIHRLASHASTELGGLALAPGVLIVFCLSVARTARSR